MTLGRSGLGVEDRMEKGREGEVGGELFMAMDDVPSCPFAAIQRPCQCGCAVPGAMS